jgi:glycosyltransferase involved in cell wall biosynthesis
MRIGFDITPILYQRGVSRYTHNLIQALIDEKGIDLSLFGSSLRQHQQLLDYAEKTKQRAPSTQTNIRRLPPSALEFSWHYLGLPKISQHLPGMDVFHSWDWLQPPDKNLPLVSTIHDLAILRFPETAHPKVVTMHRRAWEILKERQARLIAVSRATKQDLVEMIGYPNYLIHVVHEALPLEVRQVSDQMTEEEYDQIKDRLQLNQPFLFFVGTREPRKNLARLIQAWEKLAPDYQLIIAGEAGWDGVDASLSPTTTGQLRFLGKVTDQELSVLYAEAACFVYPSLYEGFGLPILESFHHGTPVVTSDNSGMREVAGNAAELVDPTSVESIREGIMKILDEDTTAQKQRLQRMIIRQHMFDWQKVARETIAVYQQAIQDAENQ